MDDLRAFANAYDGSPNQRRAALADADVVQLRDGLVFDGYAAVFDTPAEIDSAFGPIVEEVRHGAFRKVLASGANIPLCVDHDTSQLLGTTRSGRVRLTEEPRGLRVQATLADTDLSRRVKALVDSGDMTGMSYGFVAGSENTDWTQQSGKTHRLLKGFKRLIDVCTTWDPAYAATEAQFRSLAMANPLSADVLQQFLLGAYPQLEEQGDTEPDEPSDQEGEHRTSGVSGAPLLAARKRRLQLLTISLEGDLE